MFCRLRYRRIGYDKVSPPTTLMTHLAGKNHRNTLLTRTLGGKAVAKTFTHRLLHILRAHTGEHPLYEPRNEAVATKVLRRALALTAHLRLTHPAVHFMQTMNG